MSWKEALVRVIKGNRVTLPKELRETLKLEPPRLLRLTLSGVDSRWHSIEFYARLRDGGQVTIPVELFKELGLRHGQTILIRVFLEGRT